VNQPPTLSASIVTDARPTKNSLLTCSAVASDADHDALTLTYAWQVNGLFVPGATGTTLANAFVHGQTVTCSVTAADKWSSTSATSSGVFIHDILPTIASATVSGSGICTDFTCTASGVFDGDGDPVTVHYRWFVAGVDQGIDQPALPAGSASSGNTIYCQAWGDDGAIESGTHLYGLAVTSNTVIGYQQRPVVSALVTPPGEAHAGDTLACSGTISDV
jgi:hypothetical protein